MTATYQGRLSLNPIVHVDPIGTVILPLILLIMKAPVLLGWAKPVPVNPLKFRKPEWDVVVSLAGPGSNFAMVIAAAIVLKVLLLISVSISVPIVLLQILVNFIFINVLLGCFNLIPIPPLDGSHLLFHFVARRSSSALQHFAFLEQYGFLILVVLLFMTPLRYLFFEGIVGNIFWFVLKLVLG